jgi:hypothetical protein
LLYDLLVSEERGMKRISKILMLLCVLAALGLMACETGDGETATPTPTPTATATPAATVPVTVIAQVGFFPGVIGNMATITVSSGGTPITSGLTVSVNGTPCTYDTSPGTEAWTCVLADAAVGSSVTFLITGTGINISESMTLPAAPDVTAPTTAVGPYDSTADMTVAWTAAAPIPEGYVALVMATASGNTYLDMAIPNSDTTYVIPGGTFEAGLSSSSPYSCVFIGSGATLAPSGASYESSGTTSAYTMANFDASEPIDTDPLP